MCAKSDRKDGNDTVSLLFYLFLPVTSTWLAFSTGWSRCAVNSSTYTDSSYMEPCDTAYGYVNKICLPAEWLLSLSFDRPCQVSRIFPTNPRINNKIRYPRFNTRVPNTHEKVSNTANFNNFYFYPLSSLPDKKNIKKLQYTRRFHRNVELLTS